VIQSEAVIASAVPARPYLALACSRLIDFCVATLVGIMVLPVIILAIITIKLVDPGPALYIQNRQGKDGRPFRFFKLVYHQRMQLLGTRGRIEMVMPFTPPPDRASYILIDDGRDLGGSGICT
jgi:hypothetical protein